MRYESFTSPENKSSTQRTYDSECELRRQACLREIRNEIKHEGFCGELSTRNNHNGTLFLAGTGLCATHHCTNSSVCIEEDNKPVCRCPTCGNELKEVCGSNGITYINECHLRRDACRTGRVIYARYEDVCGRNS